MEYDSERPVLLFRKWKVEPPSMGRPEHTLIGSYYYYQWPTGENGPVVAECRTRTKWTACKDGPLAQAKICKCGLHGHYTFSDAVAYENARGRYGFVVGVIAAGGRVLFDAKHARAGIADVLCLIDPVEYGPQTYRTGNPDKGFTYRDNTPFPSSWAERTAERYGVPMLTLEEAMVAVSGVGNFVYGVKDANDGTEYVEGVDR